MKKLIPMIVLSAIVLSSLAVSIVLAKGNNQGSIQEADSQKALSPWFTRYVHHQVSPTSVDVGYYNSIAFNPNDGLPYISYYNTTNHDLMLASPQLNGLGNCGNNGDWWCRAVDGDGLEGRSTDDTGQYSSIAFWKSTAGDGAWKLGISYYNATTHGLRYAVWACTGSCHWEYHNIATGTEFYEVGWYTSLHFDSNGNPHIAYYASNSLGADNLFYATYVGDGTGNCGPSDNWWCQMVDSGTGVGKYASLDLRYDDTAYISYYHEGLRELRYAYYAGIGNCGNGDAWYCTTIDSNGNVGAHTSLVAPNYAGDIFRVAYYNLDYHLLKYAQSGMSGGSGNCGPSNSWKCSVVDDMSASLPVGISMQMDPNGYPMIAYKYTDPEDPQAHDLLRIARPYMVYEDGDFGNCGIEPGYIFQFWRCTTLDNGGYYGSEADFVSLAINQNGLGVISYSEEDGYYLTTHLKMAYQLFRVFLPLSIR